MLRRRSPRPARRQPAGAAALLLACFTSVLMTGGIAAVDAGFAAAAQSRAENAADAVAHAAAALLAVDPDRDRLSIAVQGGSPCDSDAPEAEDGGGPACARALAEARRLARSNGAAVVRLTVGPDLRDVRADRGAGRLLVLAEVAVRRGLPVLPARCPARPGSQSDLCWVLAWSAAQEAG